MKTLDCREVGMDCGWKTTGRDEQEILAKAKDHAKTEHNMDQIPDDVLQKVKAAIHDEPVLKTGDKDISAA